MSQLQSTSAVSVSSGRRKEGQKHAMDDHKYEPEASEIARNGTRSAFAAFGDEGCESAESPARKKQNTSTSIARIPFPEKRSNATTTSVENDIQNVLKNDPRDFDVDLLDSPVNGQIILPRLSIENDDGKVFELVPPTKTLPAKSRAATKTPSSRGADKTTGIENKALSTENVEDDNLKSANPDVPGACYYPSESIDSRKDKVCYGYRRLDLVGIFLFNIFVLVGMIWSGLLLNEQTMYKLKSMECTNRLHQAYQAMDLISEYKSFDDSNDESNIFDRFEQHEFYWKELEAQVRYWKKEAKKYQRYGDAFRLQCQEDLKHLLTEIYPQNVDSR